MTSFDLRHVLRRLLHAPGFSAVSVLLLGLAFAAFACVASVVHGLLLKPLPFPQADRLVTVESRVLGIPFDVGLSTPLREEIAAHARGIDGIAAYRTSSVVQRDDGGRRIGSLDTALVEPGLFGLLGAQPALGRLFVAEDAAAGAAGSVVLSWDEWQQRYGGAADAVGRTLRLEDRDYRVVGVLPKGFVFPAGDTRLWLPLAFSAEERARTRAGNFDGTLAIARLRDGSERTATADELNNLARAIPELDGAFGGSFTLRVEPLRSLWTGERRDALLLMLLAVAMVWLVTAANVTNLFLARALERRHESALTAALGATPWRRARTAVTEAAMLCLAGAALGCALLPAGLALLRHFDLLPTGTPQAIGIDPPTVLLLIALAALLCAALAFAGLSVQRGNLNDMIRRGGSRQTASGAARTARKSLVVAQVALTVALLFGIGVLLRSSQNLLAEDVGFRRDHLLYVSLYDLVPSGATPELRTTRLTELAERTRALPGVAAAGLGSMIPFGSSIATTNYTPPGQDDIKDKPIGYDQKVDAGYFAALGIPLLRGRGFDADEVRTKAPVAVVDETFVKRHFGEADPLGKHFKVGAGADLPDREVTIVGVVPTLKQRSLDEVADRPAVYQPDPAPPYAALAVRTTVDPSALVAPLKTLGADIAPQESIGPIVTLGERIAGTLKDRTRLNDLLGLLGSVALLLAAVGLYAVLAYAVRQRTAEFGVRMALGARASNVRGLVLGQGLVLVGAGIALGLPLAWAFARMLSSRLYRVGAFDLSTLAAVAAALVAVGLLACWWPARRAARVDPLVALRDE
ncbi:ADOP family duplicated permease [Dokdonella sp.]|uniref:ADOP family duplicated permease n=1 Tax=Dokdonella sp. TaxID=2291710 RepID=UPI001B0D693D|nr:ADOP family duplicated permease [Dokdonella sp.]MBO9663916.1 ABC transporter permease [Dokdonella sp.]